MNDTFYIISRGYEGKALTSAQRKSSLFAEEPVVMGKVLRRGSKPFRLTPAEFEANKDRLRALEAAGAIKIQAPVSDQTFLDEVDQSKIPDKMLEQQKLMQEQEQALAQQRADAEAAALAALEADNKAKEEQAPETPPEVKAEEPVPEVVPEPMKEEATVPPPPPSAPRSSEKKSHSKKGKG